jgi:two-component system, NarL family, sensor kinase
MDTSPVLGGGLVRALRNPVVQFVLAGALVTVAVLVGTDAMSRAAAREEAVTDARTTTEVLAHSVAEPLLPLGLAEGSSIQAGGFDRAARDRLMVGHVERIKIWNADGLVVYSDRRELEGRTYALGDDARAVLSGGGSEAGVSDLRRPENRYEIGEDGMLEVYTRITSPEGEPLLFEAYYPAERIAADTASIFATFRTITVSGVLAIALLTIPLLWVLTRRLERSALARERLLENAVTASATERRRIARDLHEGVVHDLTEAARDLAAETASATLPLPVVRRLRHVDAKIRTSVTALRSMVLEIYPQNLRADSLAGALDELVVPAAAAGLDVRVRVEDVQGVSDDAVALLWRTAQEAVRNAVRHARGKRLDVRVRRTGEAVSLRVSDDGVGFVRGAFSQRGSFGLRSLQDLAEEAGGRLDVETGPGRGTTVLLEIPARRRVEQRV